MELEIRAIGLGLDWTKQAGIDFEQRIGSQTFYSPDECLQIREAFRSDMAVATIPVRAGRPTQGFVVGATTLKRMEHFREYVLWRAADVRAGMADGRRAVTDRNLDSFVRSYNGYLPKAVERQREGLSHEHEHRLREVIVPGNADNPFAPRHQVRNHALLLMYLDLAIRASEGVLVKLHDLDLGGAARSVNIERRPDDPDDRRKLPHAVKTLGRTLAIGLNLETALRAWLTARRGYPNAKRVPYLFLTDRGTALSRHTVGEMLVSLKAKGRGLPQELCAHVLRHTWNDRYSERSDAAGVSSTDEENERRYQCGWRPGSSMPQRYSRRHIRQAATERSLEMQKRLGGK